VVSQAMQNGTKSRVRETLDTIMHSCLDDGVKRDVKRYTAVMPS